MEQVMSEATSASQLLAGPARVSLNCTGQTRGSQIRFPRTLGFQRGVCPVAAREQGGEVPLLRELDAQPWAQAASTH